MNRISRIFFVLLLVVLPLPVWAQSLMQYQACLKGELKAWAQSFQHFTLADFKQSPVRIKFENIDTVQAKTLKQFYPPYRAALSFSNNSKYCLDIYSHLLLENKNGKFYTDGEDVEQSILLGNIPAKKWLRIAYYGYAQRAQEVCWANDHTFILAVTFLTRSGKNIPKIIIGDIRQQSFTVFENINPDCSQKTAGYKSAKLNALHLR